MPLIGDSRKHNSSNEKEFPLEMAGIEYSFSDELISSLNTELDLGIPPPKGNKEAN